MPDAKGVLAMTRIGRGAPADLLVGLYIGLVLMNSLVQTSIPRRALVLVGVLLLAYEAFGFRSMKYEQYFLYALGAWIALGLTLNGVIFGEWVQESVYLPGNIGVALALCRGHVERRTTGVLFYVAGAYFAYRLVTVSSPGAIHQILVTGSANGISAFMIMLCCLHYAVTMAKGARITLLPAVVCLLVSALTLGRSGMAAAALLLAGIALHDLVREHRRRLLAAKLVVYGGVALAVVVLVLPRLDMISFVFERFSAFGLGSEGRDRIWGAYGESLAGIATLVGHGREEVFAGYTNVHNSYILWHKSMGVMAIPLYALAVLSLAQAAVRDRMLFLIMAVLLLRAFFDELILPFRLLDFLFFYLACTILVTLSPRRGAYPLPRPAVV